MIGSTYRPPNSDVTFLDQLQTSLSQILKEKIVILGGDFNFPHIDWDLWKVKTGTDGVNLHRAFIDIMEEGGLHQVQMNMTPNDNHHQRPKPDNDMSYSTRVLGPRYCHHRCSHKYKP